jgi:catechol 2,3-dioxygenase-like lactoylglutathione lyase family enzyme
MAWHISIVPVAVTNQDAALRFYTEKLGFELRADASFGEGFRWIEVAPPGGQTSLVLMGAFGMPDAPKPGSSQGIGFNTDDIQSLYQELSGRGVEFTEAPNPQPWGTQAQFKDLDGNGFVVVQPAMHPGA